MSIGGQWAFEFLRRPEQLRKIASSKILSAWEWACWKTDVGEHEKMAKPWRWTSSDISLDCCGATRKKRMASSRSASSIEQFSFQRRYACGGVLWEWVSQSERFGAASATLQTATIAKPGFVWCICQRPRFLAPSQRLELIGRLALNLRFARKSCV